MDDAARDPPIRATVEDMGTNIWDLDDPAATLRQIAHMCAYRPGRSVVAAVRLGDQVVTAAKVVTDAGRLPNPPEDSDLARSVAQELVPERFTVTTEHGGMSHVLITVVCRDGYVLAGRQEFTWMRAWRYSNHFTGGLAGDVYIVTPHGWTGTIDRRAGREPSLGRAHLTAVE